jgi:hypothetical protein
VRVLPGDRIAAVVADAEALAAEAVARRDRPDLALSDDPVVDVELEPPVGLVVLALALLGELDADDVGSGRRHVGDQHGVLLVSSIRRPSVRTLRPPG